MRLVWAAIAVQDLRDIWAFLERRNPAAAEYVHGAIMASVRGLTSHPLRGRSGQVEGTRELIVSRLPYIVVYEVKSDHIAVYRVRHGAQLWPPNRTR
jgi:addiction module RelE/StbE family toxin